MFEEVSWIFAQTYPVVLFSMPGVDLMVRVVGFGSLGPEFKSRSAVELIPGVVNWVCHPSEVGKMSVSMLVYQSGNPSRIVLNSQEDCLSSTNALHRVWSQSPPPPLSCLPAAPRTTVRICSTPSKIFGLSLKNILSQMSAPKQF